MSKQSQTKKQLEVDVQNLRDMNVELRRLLQQNEVQIRKIQHQIKNNLQILASFLRLQSSNLTDINAARYLNDTALRLNFFSLMQTHFFMHNHDTISLQQLENFVLDVQNRLLNHLKIETDRIKFDTEFAAIEIPAEQSMTLGFIISEILKLLLELAPDESEKREIKLGTTLTADNLFLVNLTDSLFAKMGYIERFMNNRFEIQIVQSLIQFQLGGQIQIPDTIGKAFSFRFKLQKIAT